jgi:hypothetical protein
VRFLKVNSQAAVNTDKIETITVGGMEGRVELIVNTIGETFVLRRFKTFGEAEIALAELVAELERQR